MNQPNILVILTEDLSPHAKIFGDVLSPLTSVDAIAENAIVFENAFCTAPVCSPSRFSLVTGIEPASNSPAQHHGADSVIPEDLELLTTPLRKAGYYCTNFSKADYNFVANMPEMWDDFSQKAHWRNRKKGQPFFAFFNLIETHESSIFREDVGDVSPNDIELPPYLPDTKDIRDDFSRYYNAMKKSEVRIGKLLQELDDDGLTDSTVIIQISDHGGSTPRTKRFVYDSGNKVPLVIKIPKTFSNQTFYRKPARVSAPVTLLDFAPTVIQIAGEQIPKSMQGASLLDVPVEDTKRIVFTGRDRMDENYDLIRTARTSKYLYIRNYFPNRPWLQYQSFAWQARGYQSWEEEFLSGRTNELQSRYFGLKPAEELYDTDADPHQVENLIDSSELSEVAAELRNALDRRTLRIRDNGFIPEGSIEQGLVNSKNDQIYPLAEILKIANLSIHSDVANGEYFVKQLKSDSAVVRFWAAQGLLMLGTEARGYADQVLAGLDDASDHVRIVLAELAATLGHREESLQTLRELLDVSKPFEVLIRLLKSAVQYSTIPKELLPEVTFLAEQCRNADEIEYLNVYNAAMYFIARARGTHSPWKIIFDNELFTSWLNKRFSGILNDFEGKK